MGEGYLSSNAAGGTVLNRSFLFFSKYEGNMFYRTAQCYDSHTLSNLEASIRPVSRTAGTILLFPKTWFFFGAFVQSVLQSKPGRSKGLEPPGCPIRTIQIQRCRGSGCNAANPFV